VFDVLLDLTRLDVVPTAVSQARAARESLLFSRAPRACSSTEAAACRTSRALPRQVLKSLCNKSRGAAAAPVGATFQGAAATALAAAALQRAAAYSVAAMPAAGATL